MNRNLVSFAMTEETFADLKLKLGEIEQKVEEFALELHITDKTSVQTMGNRSIPFTEYAYMMANERKDLVPAYLDVEEFNKDITLFKQARELLQTVEIIRERLVDTTTAAGADAFCTARKFYSSIKSAVKSEIPGSTVIYDEMKKRFLKMKDKNSDDTQLEKTGVTPAEKKE